MPLLAPDPLPTDLRQLPARRPESPVLFVQGAYYLLLGLWPVLDPDTFGAATGSGTALWLIRVFGLVVAAVGLNLVLAARKPDVAPQTARFAVTVALTIAAADVLLVFTRTIPVLYLVDVAVELLFVFWWARVVPACEPELADGLTLGAA